MEEQPHGQPEEQPAESSDGQPKFFKSMNGMIAGSTALVIAVGGLATTWDKIFGGDKPAEQTTPAEPQAAATATPAEKQAVDEAGPEEGDPSFYEIDEGGSLRFIDGLWVETSDEGKYRYEEVSNDGVMTVAVDRGAGENGEDVWLRWPNAGGQAQQSLNRQESWTDVFNVYVPEEPAS